MYEAVHFCQFLLASWLRVPVLDPGRFCCLCRDIQEAFCYLSIFLHLFVIETLGVAAGGAIVPLAYALVSVSTGTGRTHLEIYPYQSSQHLGLLPGV